MEEYREKLKIQNITMAVCAVILAFFSLWAVLGELGILAFPIPQTGDSHWHSRWRGYVTGSSVGLLTFLVISLIRNAIALKNEKALKKLYIKNHDERSIQVGIYARAAAMQSFLLLGLAAIVICGYFSMTVSVTVLACVLAASFLSLGLKIYFSKKF